MQPKELWVSYFLKQITQSLLNTLQAKLTPFDITIAQIFVMLCVSKEDGLSQNELAKLLQIKAPSLTSLLDQLEKKGLIERRPANKELNQWTISLLNVQPNDRILEVGFGPGIAIQEISGMIEDGSIVGIDPSQTMLSQAQKRNAFAIRQGKVRLYLSSVENLPAFDYLAPKMLRMKPAYQGAEKIAEYLKEAGFSMIKLDVKKMRPVSAASVIGFNP
ncbi:hypothetical protein BSNK01_01040 [Bacillaceae bacterium]